METALNTSALRAGLMINLSRTKILSLHSNCSSPVDIVGQATEPVIWFTYFGYELAEYGRTDKDIEVHISKALKSFEMMSSVLNSSSIHRRLKVKLFKSNILSGTLVWVQNVEGY